MRCSGFEVRSRLWAESRRDAVKPKEKRNHSADHRHRAAGREKASLGCQSPPFAFVRWVLPKLCMNQKLDPAKLLSHQPCPLTRPGGGRGSKTKILLSRCPHLRRGAGGEGVSLAVESSLGSSRSGDIHAHRARHRPRRHHPTAVAGPAPARWVRGQLVPCHPL